MLALNAALGHIGSPSTPCALKSYRHGLKKAGLPTQAHARRSHGKLPSRRRMQRPTRLCGPRPPQPSGKSPRRSSKTRPAAVAAARRSWHRCVGRSQPMTTASAPVRPIPAPLVWVAAFRSMSARKAIARAQGRKRRLRRRPALESLRSLREAGGPNDLVLASTSRRQERNCMIGGYISVCQLLKSLTGLTGLSISCFVCIQSFHVLSAGARGQADVPLTISMYNVQYSRPY